MAKIRGVTPGSVGEVLAIFRDGQPHTKQDLIALTGLARSTVTARVDVLHDAGLIVAAGEAASSGGRPSVQLAFNASARVIVAIELTASRAHVGVCDLAGNVLATDASDISISAGPIAVLDWAVSASHGLLRQLGRRSADVLGVGVGVPGPVEYSTGRPSKPQIMPGWDGFDIPAYVSTRLAEPVMVDNDVNLLAVGERAIHWPDVDDLLFVKVSTGIGAGIISGGQLQRGALGTAGDIGRVQVPRTANSTRDPRDERDLESLASGSALAAELGTATRPLADVSALVAALRRGERDVIAAVRQSGRNIGEVVAIMVNVLNPSLIVVGGRLGVTGEELLAGIREVVYQRSTPLATQHLQIVQSAADTLGGLRGAAQIVLDSVLAPEHVDQAIDRMRS
ncbi:MAG: ROK family protein [Gordonia sp. (in: high G+C Gram-positive bacteria)]